MADIDRPHIQFPFRRGGPRRTVVCVEQDTAEHLASCVAAIVACPAGARVERPEFGWPFPMFRSQPLNLDALELALRQFEPRSDATAQDVIDLAQMAAGIAEITVNVPVAEDSNG